MIKGIEADIGIKPFWIFRKILAELSRKNIDLDGEKIREFGYESSAFKAEPSTSPDIPDPAKVDTEKRLGVKRYQIK